MIAELMADLARRGVHVWAEDGQLVIRAPSGVLTPEMRAALSQHKPDILARLLDGTGEPLFSFPLSYNQRSIWLLHQMSPHSAAYNVAFAACLRSRVDVQALRHTFRKLIERHPALRTTYGVVHDEPVQQIRGCLPIHFEETDASSYGDEELRRRVVEDYHRPFDLEHGPLLRVSLFTRSTVEHVLLIAVHHIACDGSSLMLLLDELGHLYPAFKEGRTASLPPLEAQYVDYVQWQTEMLTRPEAEQQWKFWQEELAGELPVLALPADRPRPPVHRFVGSSQEFNLSAQLTERLKQVSREEGATLYMILLAAYQVLLHRYTGQAEVLVGSSTFGRSRPEFARVIGHFVNPVVLRADLKGEQSFRTFLRSVRGTVLAALSHQDLPFPLLVERLQPARDFSYTPIFQALFVLQRLHGSDKLAQLFKLSEADASVDLGGLELAPFPLAQQEGQFDLRLDLSEADGELFGVMQYNSDIFEPRTISTMLVHFQTLLESVTTDPDEQVSNLRFLSKAETKGHTAADFPAAELSRQDFERLIMELGRNTAANAGL
jgi:hypothetical protein